MCNKNTSASKPATIESSAWFDLDIPIVQAGAIDLEEDDHHFSICCDDSTDNDSSIDEHPLATESNTNETKSKRSKVREARATDTTVHRHLVTQHNYHDHAADPIVSVGASFAIRRKANQIASHASNLSPPFPTKLYEMIEQMEAEGFSHVVSWQPHGRCFKVHQISAFKLLLPNFFKLSKIASFQRQLNLYGFQRLTVGLDKGSYYHELFLRSRPDLLGQIERVKVKGTGVRAKANPDDEPNFYMYPPVPENPKSTAYPISVQETQSNYARKTGDVSDLTLFSITDIVRNTRSFTNQGTGGTGSSNDDCGRPYTDVNGLMRNLSSLHFQSHDDSALSNSMPRIEMQNAIFPIPSLLRNVSSRILTTNDQPIASVFAHNGSQISPLNDLVRSGVVPGFHSALDISGISSDATYALNNLQQMMQQDGDDDSDISFDKLVDEMFDHDQELSFPDLLQLATETNQRQFTGSSNQHRHSM